MNLGQLVEGTTSKTVMYCESAIKDNPNNTKDIITWLNENVIKHIDTKKRPYYNRVQDNIINNLSDVRFRNKFVDDINKTNLYIHAPGFVEVNLRELMKCGISPNENVRVKKETIEFLKDKLKLKIPFTITSDVVLKNIYCAPIYVLKLYKLSSHNFSARDLGPIKSITNQPLRGRAANGGSKLGQMEIEALLSHGVLKTVKEVMTCKSDWTEGKSDLLYQIIKNGKYIFPSDKLVESRTKKVVNLYLKFLKS